MAGPVIKNTGSTPRSGAYTSEVFAGEQYKWIMYTVSADAGALNVVLEGALGKGGLKDYLPQDADFATNTTITVPGVYKLYAIPSHMRFRVITGTNVIITTQQRTDEPTDPNGLGGTVTTGGAAPTIVPFLQGNTVVVGNLTNYNGALYPVTTAHTFSATFDPAKHGSPVAVPGTNGSSVVNRGPFAATTVYAANDIVSNVGQLYSAKVTFTSGATFVGTDWNLIVAKGADGAAGTFGLITGLTGGDNNTLVYQTGATTVESAHPSLVDELNSKNLFWKDNTGQYWYPGSVITDAAGSNLTVGFVRAMQPQVVNNGINYRDIDPSAAIPTDMAATINQDYVEFGRIINATQWRFREPQVDGAVLNPVSRYDSFLVANYPRAAQVPVGRFLLNQWTVFDDATPSQTTVIATSTNFPHNVQVAFRGVATYGTRVATDQVTAQAADGQVQALLTKGGATGKYGVAMRVSGTSAAKNGVILTIDEDQPTASALQLISYNANAATTYTANFAFVHGSFYRFKLECQGTLIRGKVWLVTDPEPTTWQIKGISSYIAAGYFGITTNREIVITTSYSTVTNKGAEAALTGTT